MPFQNQHSARLKSPAGFDRFARQNDKGGPGIDFIFGLPKEGKPELQAIRFDSKKFTVDQAKQWLKENNHKPLLFEPAAIKKSWFQKDLLGETFDGHDKVQERYLDRLAKNNKTNITRYSNRAYTHIKKADLPPEIAGRIDKLGTEFFKKVNLADSDRITNTIRKDVADIIQNGVDAGASKTAVSKELKKYFRRKKRFQRVTTSKALTIARTEMGDLSNWSTLQASFEAGATHKQWNWSGIDREGVHDVLNKKVVKLADPWISGAGNKLFWPQSGPASERINCRCTFTPLTLSDKETEKLKGEVGGSIKKEDNLDEKSGVVVEKSLTKYIKIAKKDHKKRLVYGIVYEPNKVDAHGDFTTASEIEKAAHLFMTALMKSKRSGLNFMHKQGLTTSDAVIVESYIQQNNGQLGNTPVLKGAWVMVAKIINEQLWKMVDSNKINGFSMEGRAKA